MPYLAGPHEEAPELVRRQGGGLTWAKRPSCGFQRKQQGVQGKQA